MIAICIGLIYGAGFYIVYDGLFYLSYKRLVKNTKIGFELSAILSTCLAGGISGLFLLSALFMRPLVENWNFCVKVSLIGFVIGSFFMRFWWQK